MSSMQCIVGTALTVVSPDLRGSEVLYSRKLLPATYEMLTQLKLMGDVLPNADYLMSTFTGLSIMNILADTCAGDALARVTDERLAYESLIGLFLIGQQPLKFLERAILGNGLFLKR